MRIHTANRARRSFRRRGAAPIELVLFLPLLIVLLLCILTAGSVSSSCETTAAGARGRAFLKRRTPWATPGDVLGMSPLCLREGGVQKAEEVNEPIVYYHAFRSILPSVRAENTVLSGSWDRRELRLETPPQLCLPPEALCFAQFPLALDALAVLSNVSGGGGGNKALADVRQDLRGADTSIRQLQSERDNLDREIRDLRRERRPNWPLIREKERKRADIDADLSRLRQKRTAVGNLFSS